MSAPKKRGSKKREAPYRGGPAAAPSSAGGETGLVDDLIRQFADRFAFFRELVQNSIDAGATSIHVQLAWEPGVGDERGAMRVSVRDDGSGMGRDTLENDLTVLFKSTKESRDDAIGKFGIGFVSVLAVEPEVVIVDTSKGDGTRWSLHLHADQTYDLFRADTTSPRGTTVTLVVPLADAQEPGFAESSEAALRRWCRHARVPIRFVALGGSGEPTRDVRIDEPMSVDAVVSIHARSRDGHTHVVAGLPRPGGRYAAFFNQGLLLHETRDHELGEVTFKVADARLEHTLSRDDVRRDEHYARAVELVARTLRGPLLGELAQALAQAADAFTRGSEDASARLLELLEALERSDLPVAREAIVLPVVPGARGARVVRLSELDGAVVTYEGSASTLARALARAGRPVLDLSFVRDAAALERVRALLARFESDAPPRDRDRWSLITPIEPTGDDLALLARLAVRLAHVARRPSDIVLAAVEGAASQHLAFGASGRDATWLSPSSDLLSDPFRLLMRPPLVLRVDHPIVRAARERSADAPVLASALLARAVLVSRGALTAQADAALTARAMGDALTSARSR